MLFSIPANSIFYKTEAEEKFIHFHCELYFLFNFLFNYLLWILLTVFNFTIQFNLYRIDTIFTFPLMPFHNSKYYKKPLKSFWYKRKIWLPYSERKAALSKKILKSLHSQKMTINKGAAGGKKHIHHLFNHWILVVCLLRLGWIRQKKLWG